MRNILFISFWNPTPQFPNKGVFIHDQVEAICQQNKNIVFLQVNILPSKFQFFHKEIIESDFYSNKKITLNLYSIAWKGFYVNPWLIYYIIKKYLTKEEKEFHPVIIHSNVVYPCAMVGHMLSKHFNANHIISEHWSKAAQIIKHPIFGRLALKTYKESKAIICVSNFLATKIASATGLYQTKIIPNIIDTKLFSYVIKETPVNTFQFTCCATWKLPKRLDLTVHSLIKLANLHEAKQFVLNIIGEGSQTDELKQINIPANLSINWAGFIPKNDIASILHKTDFFLHASETETFSIVTAEALSTGTPVLGSKTGALPELIKPSNGVLVENSIDAWLKGLSAIMENHYDHESIAKEFSNKFSPESIAQRILEVYKDVSLS